MDGDPHSSGVIDPSAFEQADDNVVQPFQLEASALRGRMVRLGSVLDDVLTAHDYPAPVAHLVAETMTLCALLSSMLKYDGVFSLQAKGDGPIGMLLSDMTSDGDLRACATFDAERLEHSREQLAALKTKEGAQNHLAQYLGKGYIAFTVQPNEDTGGEKYQGIVELKGASLIDCVQHYFNQSEQIKTGIKMAVGQRDGHWRAGGLMLQMMPEEGGHTKDGAPQSLGNLDEDDWRRAMILLDSAKDDEILDAQLHSNVLLRRLYHEDGVRVFEPLAVQHQCRCSLEKVESVIALMNDDDLSYLLEDDKIVMRCEFCSRDYVFDPEQLKK